ncbi:MAG: helix-turn-helix transcriptional regulator [Acidobacteria bacterium]|nr:helix-turn-helix transcriptional regulator [Acidobacteriota bacterium]
MSTSEVHLPPVFVEKRGAAWGPVRVEHYRLRAGELPEHEHREHLLLLSLSGCRGEMRTAGGFSASAQARGGVCLIPSGEPFSTRVGGDTECLGIYLDPALVERAARDADPSGRFEVVARSNPRDPLVNRVGMALLGEMDSEAPGARLYAESLANVLAVHVLRNYAAAGAPRQEFKGGLSGVRLRRVLSYIEENHERDLTLEDLAGEAAMSTFHFAREFKRATGTTPHQHLIKFRVERAKALLAESRLPLAEVGLRTGFSHQSHFTRLFRRLTGTTPQSYRVSMSRA